MTDSDLQQKRLVAAAIDAAMVVVLVIVLVVFSWVVGLVAGRSMAGVWAVRVIWFLGALAITAAVLLRDVLVGGRSPGKKVQQLRVVAGSAPISVVDSVKRNLVFGIGPVLWLIRAALDLAPCLGQMVNCLLAPLYILSSLAMFVAVVVEVFKIVQDPSGVRFGDQFANTRVVREA
jgi:hypothetical protein